MTKRTVHQCDACGKIKDSIISRPYTRYAYAKAPEGWLVVLDKDACSKECGKELIDMTDDSRCCPTCGTACEVCGDNDE